MIDTELGDDPTRHRVTRGALGETLFVEAGAGSGKTTLLVERIVNLVLETGARLASVAAITFTEAAATELASRIRARFEIEQAAALGVGDEERADRCRGAIADSDLAAITTLHGFANRILGEFAVAAGLPPQIRVLDEVSSQLAHQDRWLRFVDRLNDTEEHREVLLRASALGIPLEARFTNQTTMRDVAVEFNQNWDRLGGLIAADLGPAAEIDFVPFDAAVDEVARCAHDCTDPDDKLYLKLQDLLPRMQAIRRLDDPVRKLRALVHAGDWKPGNLGTAKGWGEVANRDHARACVRTADECKAEVLAPVIDDVLARLSQLIAHEIVDAARARRTDGGLEFHDLLVLARNLLRTDDAARAALHERFRHVLLDEFQDTDPIQIELAMLIATDTPQVDHVRWSELEVEPGRLFFVGDPKQSIYRFRRADIALFLQARDRFAGASGSAQLSTNFRTVEPIVEWVNAMFEQVMNQEIPGSQPRYERLVAHRRLSPADADRHRPVLLGGPHDDPKVSAADLRAIEAADMVGLIRAIVADPGAWPVEDPVTRRYRAARLEDITILVPTRTSLPFLRAELDQADLRYQIATGTLVYDTQEVADALATIRAIDDPTDELSLVAALRSPLYGCSDVDLVTWRNAGGRWDVRAEFPTTIEPGHPVADAIDHLRGLWRERWFLTPSGLLERLLRERHAALLAFGDPRTTDVWRRLRFLVEQARTFEETGSGGLRGFTQWAALQAGSRARVHEPLLPETDEAGISIQTIHGAKGLEFPITILSGMTTQIQGRRSGVSVLWGDDGSPSVRLRSGVESTRHEPLADVEAEMDDHERLRLAYVAVTRARDHLIVSCHHKQSGAAKTYGGQFSQLFDNDERRGLWRRFDWRQVVGDAGVERPRAEQLGLALDDREKWVEDRAALLAPYRRPRVLSATGVAQVGLEIPTAGPTPGEQIDEDDDGADQPDQLDHGGPRRRGRTGSAIGSAVHAVLQRVDLRVPGDLDDHVAQQCQMVAIPDRTQLVRQLVEGALASAAVGLARSHTHYKELFVTAPIEGLTIEGYVDLVIEGPHGLIVVDYKTDTIAGPNGIDDHVLRYELQAASYALALEAVTGRHVVECRFVFCTTNGAIERAVPDLASAKRRARDTVARFRSN